jgi:hypothetical protein
MITYGSKQARVKSNCQTRTSVTENAAEITSWFYIQSESTSINNWQKLVLITNLMHNFFIL